MDVSSLLPEKFTYRMQALLREELPAFLKALNEVPPISLRMNPRKPSDAFSNEESIPWCATGKFLKERPRFIMDPLIHAGAYYVQEASSMLVAPSIEFFSGMKVLDLCASPGGKSTLLATSMDEHSLLVSNEMVGQRAIVLRDNLSRWGYANVVVTCNRPEDFASVRDYFDVVLVDAPCSGEGMFRKDPEVINQWTPANVAMCAERQKQILISALTCLKPGGTLIYSTCTYNPDENEDNLLWMLEQFPAQLTIEELGWPSDWGTVPGLKDGYPESVSRSRHCFPHHFRGEGFFIAKIRKEGSIGGAGKAVRKLSGTKINAAPKWDAGEWIQNPNEFTFLEMKEEIIALPQPVAAEIKNLSALTIVKAGITCGKLNGKKFIPDHDLAMSRMASEEIPRIELDPESAIRFLKREEIKPETNGYTGWALTTFECLELGWMKALGNRVNIHLPKELKIRVEE